MLVQLYSRRQPPNAEPLAIETLAGTVLAVRPQARVRQRSVGDRPDLTSVDELLAELKSDHAVVLGVSVPQGCLSLAMALASGISRDREAFADVAVVWGHALPTYMPERFLEALEGSSVVRGWGERQFLEIALPAIDQEVVGGGRLVGCSPDIDDCACYGIPARPQGKGYLSRIEASRGCSYGRCAFCTRPLGPRQAWAPVPVARVLDEVGALVDEGVAFFTFTDEDFFGTDPERLMQLARGLRNFPGIRWSASIRAIDVLDQRGRACSRNRRSLLESLKEAGLGKVFIGVESLSRTQLRRYAKGITAEGNIEAVQLLLNELNMDVEIGFMPFDSLVTLEEIRESVGRLVAAEMSGLVCNPVGRARVQIGSAMATDPRIMSLSHGFDADTMSYLCGFRDARVEPIYSKACMEWRQALPQYIASRSEDRARIPKMFDASHRALQAMRSAALLRLLNDVDRAVDGDPLC